MCFAVDGIQTRSKQPIGGEKANKQDDDIFGTKSFSVIQSSVNRLGVTGKSSAITSGGQQSAEHSGNSEQGLQPTSSSVDWTNGASQPQMMEEQRPAADLKSNGSGVQEADAVASNINNSNDNAAAVVVGSAYRMPASLANLQNPQTFHLDGGESPSKKRVTKASFGKKDGIKEATNKPDDPLSMLDPMWNLKVSASSASNGDKSNST